MIYIIGPKDKKPDCLVINTTTSSQTWSRNLSPMLLGPVKIKMSPNATVAQNMENAWQFSKVYPEHTDKDGNPSEEYWKWAKKGFSDKWAHRYPMGKNKRPLYAFYDNQKYDYIEARKNIYVPLYTEAVIKTEAFKVLKDLCKDEKDIALFDFDGYNSDLTNEEILNNTNKKMGHAFVLKFILDEQ